ncbi:DMT family transporter [Paludibacterium paludis]|uniref:Membrane protein n=1 Tax=Paludibacterium paludis TaxID=1225769 RepID=A0A918P6P4_9NEIS|nr:DMT family transporter [Paludibacterium paludis]GGY27368.1 membrane protein [Paludibacterium paludis]
MPYLALTLAMLLWSSSFIALKYVFVYFDPLQVLLARMLIATAGIVVILLWRRETRWHYRKGDWKWMLAMALAEPCLYFLCEARALTLTSASQAAIITATLPLLAALGARMFLGERIGAKGACGILVSFLGVAALTLGGQAEAGAPDPALGNALEFLAMICATGYVLIAKRLTSRYSTLAVTAMQTVTGGVWFGAWVLLSPAPLPVSLPLLPSLVVLYLGLFITLGAYGLYTWSVSRVPVAMAAAFINLIPVFTVGMAWLALDERLSGWQAAACLLVFAGVAISQKKTSGAAKPDAGRGLVNDI